MEVALLHRLAFRLAHAVRVRWWRLRKPRVEGCRVVALNQGCLLLIRHSYGSREWMLPGGGLHRGEGPLRAAERELLEETGCKLRNATLLEISDEDLHGARNRVHVVAGWTPDDPAPDNREIVAAAFFPTDGLPGEIARELRRRLPMWTRAADAALPKDV